MPPLVLQLAFDCSVFESIIAQLKAQPTKGQIVVSMMNEGRHKELFQTEHNKTDAGLVMKFVPTDFLTQLLASLDC